ncbi:PRTRC system protein F [Noviherbaspirillum galbum]|uniref:PRTRC system protein F n=1 Tax=Noviherbaspirillum galbum TaxID=2709383 RepID=A0A6B3SHG6_9BURK|nr:PRTRC system protein F [Noviherbaspirillum galbum]NEX60108.1 PRTRC system protein F [Noviherbaspirillum galbum]
MFLDVEYARLIPKGPGHAGAQGIPAAPVLTIPRLAAEIPMEFQQPTHPSLVLLVRQLYRAGVIKQADLDPDVSIPALLESVLRRGVHSTLGSTELSNFLIGISDSQDDYYEVDGRLDDHIDEDKMPTADEQVRLFMAPQSMPTVFVGKKIAALEGIEPGLGQTVYAALEWAAWGGIGVFTISHVLHDIPYLYNLEDGDDIDLDEDGEGTTDPNEDDDERITADVLKQGLPDWADKAKLLLTPAQCLKAIQRPDTPEWAKQVVHATLAAADVFKAGTGNLGFVDRYEQEPFFRQAIIRFSDEDQIGRAADDYENMANQCSDNYTDLVHLARVDLRDVGNVKKWWQGVFDGCKLIHAIDQLLLALNDD